MDPGAANGVVLITTKRGRAGKTDFSFNSFAGIQEVPRKIPFLNSDQLVALEEDARAQDLIAFQQDPAPLKLPIPVSIRLYLLTRCLIPGKQG